MSDDARHGMFLLQGDDLVGLSETPYDSEDLLQRFLAEHPDLLAGHQIDPVTPRRWLLVDREVGIPDATDAAARWSLDHLFLDQDGIPTIVEVKRSSDTRIRREVVGQMLEYAANAIVHVPAERIRAAFEGQCAGLGRDPVEVLLATFGADTDIDAYWAQVADNIGIHRVRLVFVADVIPPELARIVEYLNEQMRTTEVLAVELKQYTGGNLRTLVPRVIGRTAAAEAAKAQSGTTRVTRTWTVDEFLRVADPAAAPLVREALDWLQRHHVEPFIGKGKYGPFYIRVVDPAGGLHRFAGINTQGAVLVEYSELKHVTPFDEPAVRIELNHRLNGIPGVAMPDRLAEAASWPTIPAGSLSTPEARAQFFDALDWISGRIKSRDSQ